jgi:hypothetical protein
MPVGNRVGIKATPPIAHLQLQRPGGPDDFDTNAVAATVPNRIVEAFLQNAINGGFQRRRQLLTTEALNELDLDPAGSRKLLDETLDGGDDSRLHATGWRPSCDDLSNIPQSYIEKCPSYAQMWSCFHGYLVLGFDHLQSQ